MTEQAGFYSDYFTRSTFLSAEASPETARLASWGFTDPAQFAAKRVLEVGAGAGRLTRALAEHGFIQRAAEYTVLEPSAGIEPLRREIDLPNVRFIRAPLQSAGIAPASVDYLIASGVLPHLADEPLADRIGRLARLLGPAGRLHVTASWYGHPKRAAFALKRLARRAPATARALAWITAGLQTLCCDWLPARALFVPRFIYSFERTLGRRADQQLEFLRVEPYLFDGYAGYSAALAEHWLGFERLFPY